MNIIRNAHPPRSSSKSRVVPYFFEEKSIPSSKIEPMLNGRAVNERTRPAFAGMGPF
jgi:hypothetical protein